MKTYILEFNSKEEAYDKLIENAFGYISPVYGKILMQMTVGEYNIIETPIDDSKYMVQIDFIKDMNSETKEKLKDFIKGEA
jgi:hypothetical protein